jgi:hypothetical protein
MKKCLVIFNGIVGDNQDTIIDEMSESLDNSIFEPTYLISTWKRFKDYSHPKHDVIKFLHDDIDETYLDQINFPYTEQLMKHPESRHWRMGHYVNFVNVAKVLRSFDVSPYDYIIKTRTDLLLNFNPPADPAPQTVYTSPTYWGGQLGIHRYLSDHFLLGSRDDILDVYEPVANIFHDFSKMWNPEVYMRYLVTHAEKNVVMLHINKYHIKKGNNVPPLEYV